MADSSVRGRHEYALLLGKKKMDILAQAIEHPMRDFLGPSETQPRSDARR